MVVRFHRNVISEVRPIAALTNARAHPSMRAVMRYLLAYEAALKRLAESSTRLSRLGLIHVIVWPFVLAIVIIQAAFDAFGWAGAVGWTLRLSISTLLLVALLYSGFRFVHYSNRADSE